LRYGGGPGWLAALDGTLAAVPPPQGARIWLAVARQSLPRGELALARHAAERTISLAPAQSPESLSARAHLASVRLVTGDYDVARADLEGLSREALADADRLVVGQALDLAAAIRRWPAPPAAVPAAMQPPRGDRREVEGDPVDALIERTQAALARPDEPEEKKP
jgi:hypothetical protein